MKPFLAIALMVIAAVFFLLGAIEAKPHDVDNVTFDLCVGLLFAAAAWVASWIP